MLTKYFLYKFLLHRFFCIGIWYLHHLTNLVTEIIHSCLIRQKSSQHLRRQLTIEVDRIKSYLKGFKQNLFRLE